MRVVVARESASHVLVTVTERGKTTFQQRGNPSSGTYQNRVLSKVPIDLDSFLTLCPATPDDAPAEVVVGDDETAKPFFISIRDIQAKSEHATILSGDDPAELIKSVLLNNQAIRNEPVITWDGTERLAVLDIDYHYIAYEDRPAVPNLEDFARKVTPHPIAYHTSHGRGLKLFYSSVPGFSAAELAAVAALSYRSIDARATIELKRESRHPGYPRKSQYCGSVHVVAGNCDLSAVARWLGNGVTEEMRNDYLASRNWRLLERRDHSHCPMRPFLDSHGSPVAAGDYGFHCDKCRNEGYIGSSRRTPGFVSYASILHATDSQLTGMLKNFVHWSHARIVLDHVTGGLQETIARPAYEAALKLLHGDDPRIKEVFTASDIVLVENTWLAAENRVALRENVGKDQVGSLPACRDVEGRNGVTKTKVNTQRLSELRHPSTTKLKHGYHSLHPIYGAKIWGEFLPYSDGRITFLIPNPRIAPERQPTYIPPSRRGDVEAAWKLYEDACPGLSRNYVTLLIVAKGYAQGNSGPMPLIVVAGVSGAGKTGHVDIAASICGDGAEKVSWTKNRERFKQQIHQATRNGDYVKIDEVFKSAEGEKMSPREALDPLLTLDGNALNHVLYVGPQSIGRKFPVILTDIMTPSQVAEDTQLARRLTYVRLPNRVEWQKTCQGYGIPDLLSFRQSQEFADAGDIILSDTIDRYFRSATSFAEVADSLGFLTLENSTDHPDAKDDLTRYARRLIAKEPISGSDAGRYNPAHGWKAMRRDYAAGDELSELYAEFADNRSDKWATSRRLEETDWSKVLGVLSPVILDLRSYRDTVIYARFRTGDFRKPTALNGEIR